MTPASTAYAVAVQGRVINALILRDIRTRFFGNGLGYLVAIAWPLAHMGILLVAYTVTGRTSPLGNSVLVFFAVSLVPLMSFLYISRWMMHSVILNKPLLVFPLVKLWDVIFARALLEVACSCCVAAVMAAILFTLDLPVWPTDPVQAGWCFAMTIFMSLGVGVANAVVAFKFPVWAIAIIFINIVIYGSSGILFMPDAIPEQVRDILAWNPVLHSVEWMREAYYPGFKSLVLDKRYVMESGLVSLFAAFVGERLLRRFLHR